VTACHGRNWFLASAVSRNTSGWSTTLPLPVLSPSAAVLPGSKAIHRLPPSRRTGSEGVTVATMASFRWPSHRGRG
jgi:hypothetical protein